MASSLTLLHLFKRLDISAYDGTHVRLDKIDIKVPPFNFQKLLNDLLRESLFDLPGGISTDNGVRRNIFYDHSFSTNDRSVADLDPRHNRGTPADPDVIADNRVPFIDNWFREGVCCSHPCPKILNGKVDPSGGCRHPS